MKREISVGQVVLGPMEERVEAAAVVGYEGEEHPISLTFAGGAITSAMVDDPALGVERVASVALPQWPALIGATPRTSSQGEDEGQETADCPLGALEPLKVGGRPKAFCRPLSHYPADVPAHAAGAWRER